GTRSRGTPEQPYGFEHPQPRTHTAFAARDPLVWDPAAETPSAAVIGGRAHPSGRRTMLRVQRVQASLHCLRTARKAEAFGFHPKGLGDRYQYAIVRQQLAWLLGAAQVEIAAELEVSAASARNERRHFAGTVP